MIFKLIGIALTIWGYYTMYGVVNNFIHYRIRRPVAVERPVKVEKRKVATVTSDALNMREQPTAQGTLIRTLRKGDRLTVSGEAQNGWVPVEIDGKHGFVSGSYISIGEE